MNMIWLLISCCVYMFITAFVYLSKKRYKSKENRFFRYLIIIVPIGLLLEILCVYAVAHRSEMQLITLISTRALLIYYLLWNSFFSKYLFTVCNQTNPKLDDSQKEKKNNIDTILLIIWFIIGVIAVTILPMHYSTDVNRSYSYGPAVNALLVACIVVIIFWIVKILSNYTNMKNQKFIPVYVFLIFGTASSLIQYNHPEVLLMTFVEALVTFIMFFTIENPDVKMLEQVEFAKEQADRANKAKTDFLSSMSHEIRTPLNAIVGFSQSLKTEDLSPSAMEEVDDIIEASETLLDTVNGVLDISKIEANKIEIVDSVYNFYKIFDELVALSKARLGTDKPIDFRYELAPDTPKYLYGDYARVKQIALNFLTNAIKYTKEGYIDFKVRNITNDGICRLIITVEDSGIGIRKTAINKLFNKFERLDNENSTIEGTGLGLAIAKKLVELMHGRIVVQSIFGRGSQFMVILDQKLVDDKDIPMEEATAAVVNIDYSKKKILIVDDNKLNLKVATRLLKPYNVQTFEALSGFECLDLIGGGNTYDLILMDDMMPKMSGKETFKKLKEEPTFTTPVVILTANAITGMKEQYLADGFDDYLAKPIDKSELERVLRKYLG